MYFFILFNHTEFIYFIIWVINSPFQFLYSYTNLISYLFLLLTYNGLLYIFLFIISSLIIGIPFLYIIFRNFLPEFYLFFIDFQFVEYVQIFLSSIIMSIKILFLFNFIYYLILFIILLIFICILRQDFYNIQMDFTLFIIRYLNFYYLIFSFFSQ